MPGGNEYYAKANYRGDVASTYEERRTGKKNWAREQHVMGSYISGLPEGSSVLDVPFGQGVAKGQVDQAVELRAQRAGRHCGQDVAAFKGAQRRVK